MKQIRKRLFALLLCAAMLGSALPGTGLAATADAPTGSVGEGLDFSSQKNGRPDLFVDFLGDNRGYRADHGEAAPDVLAVPGGYDQSAVTNPTGPDNSWSLYSDKGDPYDGKTIFWVGVGIDRKEVWRLLEDGGLTSFEAGFYYNSTYIEPYVDPAKLPPGVDAAHASPEQLQEAYRLTLAEANIDNSRYPKNTQWSDAYDIVEAATDLDPQSDPITQEELVNASMEEILHNSYGSISETWRMTYASLELTDLDAARRLADAYDPPEAGEDGQVEIPPVASGDAEDGDYQYLLLLPFRLKAFGIPGRTALRLVRDATHFSVGAGADGVEPYAAWERVTTRNPGRDIKLLNNFLGDLDLFGSAGRIGEKEYTADLEIVSGGGTLNRAELAVDGDPSLYPVKATLSGDVIRGLRSGLGMVLRAHVGDGYQVRVTVSAPDRNGEKYPYQTVVDTGPDREFTFVLPALAGDNRNVHVLVEFLQERVGAFQVYLSEVPRPDDPGAAYGNRTTVTTTLGSINSDSAPSLQGHPDPSMHPETMRDHQTGPVVRAAANTTVRVEVQTNPNYQAKVRLLDFSTGSCIEPSGGDIANMDQDTASPTYRQITLAQGGTVEFDQVPSDVDVEVRYIPADTRRATLEVWHGSDVAVSDLNTAQLSYADVDQQGNAVTRYSGVVYENYDAAVLPPTDDHRAVKTGAEDRALPWIPTSQAALSGSLAGDGAPGAVWSDSGYSPRGTGYVMSMLYSASSAAAFAAGVRAVDFSTLAVTDDLTGLRKDVQGQVYGDGEDMTALAQTLWELRQRILADPALRAGYVKTASASGGTGYTYLDLTPAQVQAYLLETLTAQAIATGNEAAYRQALPLYDQARALYDQIHAVPATESILPVQLLAAPAGVSLDSAGTGATWRRTYQDEDYQDYIEQYTAYIRDYIRYAQGIQESGVVDNSAVSFPALTAPATRTVALQEDAAARAAVSGYAWQTPTTSKTCYVETAGGRTVWVSARGDSRYAVESVVVYRADADGNADESEVLQRVDRPVEAYGNVYAIQMPTENCVVRVTYVQRGTRTLRWQVVGAGGQKENTAQITAYRVADHDTEYQAPPWSETPQAEPVAHTVSNADHWSENSYPEPPGTIRNVFVGGTVTVRASCAEGYRITVTLNEGNGESGVLSGTAIRGEDNSYLYTYKVENVSTAATLTVSYEVRERPTNQAIITYETLEEPDNRDNKGAWCRWNEDTVNHLERLENVPQGARLEADVWVKEGYYIHSVTASGASGNYLVTLEGNGYNNGLGAVQTPVKLWTDMPGEDLEVHVVFRKGPPPVAPARTLTLAVVDEENNGEPLADNWARARVYPGAGATPPPAGDSPVVTLGALGKGGTGQGRMTQWDYVDQNTDQWVYLDLDPVVVRDESGAVTPAESYYVRAINVTPSNQQVTVEWVSPEQARFLMPSGSVGVTVEFARYTEAACHDMTVDRTESGGDSAFQNQVTHANSGTIQSWSSHAEGTNLGTPGEAYTYPHLLTKAGVPGEEVTVTYVVAGPDHPDAPDPSTDWYVQSVLVVYGGAAFALPVEQGADPNTYTSRFVMPCEDVRFVVNYRKGRPDIRDYTLTLILQDPDNVGLTPDDNRFTTAFTDPVHVQAPITLGLAQTGRPMTAVTQAHAGDRLDLTTRLAEGYALDFISIRPIGLGLHPAYTPATPPDSQAAHFTMPAADVAVVARVVRGTERQYTANLILRPPAGYDIDQAGQGTFVVPDPDAAPGDPTSSGTKGSLDSYPDQAIFAGAFTPGQVVDLSLLAKDGFYIRAVTVDPANGAATTLTGGFGRQAGTFTMPANDVYVNVWFEKLWPDQVPYDVTLNVYDAQVDPQDPASPGNYARFLRVGGTAVPNDAADATGGPVYGQQSRSISYDKSYAPHDRDTVVVGLHAAEGYYCETVRVTDANGRDVTWWSVPGGVAYTQPPQSVTVDVTFVKGTPPRHTATLHLEGSGEGDAGALEIVTSAEAEAGPSRVDQDGGQIAGLRAGDTLKLTVQPGAGRHVAAAYAVDRASGAVLPLYATADATGAATLTPGDPTQAGEGYLGMPQGDAEVYVRFAAGTRAPDDYPVTLAVSGPANGGYAQGDLAAYPGQNAQSMTVATLGSGTPAGAAQGLDARFAKENTAFTVTLHPARGCAVAKLEVYDRSGAPVGYHWVSMTATPPASPDVWTSTWSPEPALRFQLDVPSGGVTVHVTFAEADDTLYTAQVVVNDDAYSDDPTPSRNNAWLRNAGEGEALRAKLKTAKAGDWIDLDVLVHPGYRVEYIKVIPQSYGLAPDLPLGPLVDQTTGFYMPPGDVTVYVKFADDDLPELQATLVVLGSTQHEDPSRDYGTIHSPRSGTQPPVPVNGEPQRVSARPGLDWVTVDYYWNVQENSIASVSVQTISGTALPFTQELNDPDTGHGRLKLLLTGEDARVVVTYAAQPTPKEEPQGQQVVLHVIDKDGGAPILLRPDGEGDKNYGCLTYDGNNTLGYVAGTTGNLAPAVEPGTSGTILVPAGETVRLSACSDTEGLDGQGTVYIESAFVLWESAGQMVQMNLAADTPGPGFSGEKTADFVVHPGVNDVYVTLTRTPPQTTDYSAVLMIKAPEDSAGQGAIYLGDNYAAAGSRRDYLTQANHGYAYLTAHTGEALTAQVRPAAGYVVDRIVVTPLGFPLNYTQSGNSVAFEMAHCNVAITVYLKAGDDRSYTATLHYSRNDDAVNDTDKAVLRWNPSNAPEAAVTADLDPATPAGDTARLTQVSAGAPVTLDAYLQGSEDRVLAAYVLSDGALVPLAEAMEGLSNTVSDVNQPDGTAKFTMPAADVDVYLVTATQVPEGPWHTAVVVAYDTAPAGEDLGRNKGHLSAGGSEKTAVSTGHPGHVFLTVAPGETYTVWPEAGESYAFVAPATKTTNDNPNPQRIPPVSTDPYRYEQEMGEENEAVILHFRSDVNATLTVEIQDPDNPGDGSVTNGVDVSTSGLPTLALRSQSAAGSYQIMDGVAPGGQVTLQVAPADPTYSALVQLYSTDALGAEQVETVPLSSQGGALTGSFTMPAGDARVVVTFFRAYQGTLTLVDRTAASAVQAEMAESYYRTAEKRVTVGGDGADTGTLTDLPNGDVLTAQVTDPAPGQRVTGLLTRRGSTTLLTEEAGTYRHTIDRADATVTLVVDDSAHANAYLAAVETVGKPDAAPAPTVADTTTSGQSTGSIWTTANQSDTVAVTLTVPEGYRAVVRAATAAGGQVLLTNGGTPGAGAASVTVAGPGSGTVSLTMPAANVQVTVTYEKTRFALTLRVVDDSGTGPNASQATPASVVGGGLSTLTQDGQSTEVAAGVRVDLSAAPAAGARVSGVYYQTDRGETGWLAESALTPGTAFQDHFQMPQGDTVVTVVYDRDRLPGPEGSYHIATVEVQDPDHRPDNRAVSLVNRTDSGLPGSSPSWVAGREGDEILVSYQAEAGYYVTVTARRADSGEALVVLQLDSATAGTGAITMPDANAVLTLTYSKERPERTNPVALQLVRHGALEGNRAATTDFTRPDQLAGLAANGLTPDHAPHVPAYTAATDPVETVRSAAARGDDLRTLAHWAEGSQVVRMTVAVRRVTRQGGAVTAVEETPEVELLTSRYAGTATSRTPAPVTSADGDEIVLRVYYGELYTATFHLVDSGPTDAHSATDADRDTGLTLDHTSAYTSAGGALDKPITQDRDRMEGYRGDGSEEVRSTVTAGPDRRVTGVVWESAGAGAASATLHEATDDRGGGRYDFTMPGEDVDFYAIYQDEPADPADRTYIAKVAFASGSRHLEDSRNAVSIANDTRSDAPQGRYWVGARGGDAVSLTVKVAPGYQASIVTARIDDPTKLDQLPQVYDGGALRAPTVDDAYQYYLSRTAFDPNLTAGRTATFTMPVETDATVTVRFTRGYDLTLGVTDQSGLDGTAVTGTNRVTTTYDSADALTWTHEGAAAPTTQSYLPASARLRDRESGKTVTTQVTPYADTVRRRVTRYSPFTGTVELTDGAGGYPFAMPEEDAAVQVLLQTADAKDDLLAKVELLGDSDVTGNTAAPVVDHTDSAGAVTGTVWTTTSEGNTIDLTLTVAQGYAARIRVRRDDSYVGHESDSSAWVYLDASAYSFTRVWNNGAEQTETMAAAPGVTEVQVGYSAEALPQQFFPDSVGGEQHFRFTMPQNGPDPLGGSDPDRKTDVTILVEFVRESRIPRPFDPRNDDSHDRHPDFLEEGFLYGENRGDYAVVEAPTLGRENAAGRWELFDADNYTKPFAAQDAPENDVTFVFYLRSVGEDGGETYTQLVPGVDLTLVPDDPEDTDTYAKDDPYNYPQGAGEGMWTGTEIWKAASGEKHDFTGARFRLIPTEPDGETGLRTPGAQALYEMLNNQGSLESYAAQGGTRYRTRLMVTARDAAGQESDYTEVWIRPWFALGVRVTSYGPTHPLEGELYRLMDRHELNVANGYWDQEEQPLPDSGLTGPETPDPKEIRHYRWDEETLPALTATVVEEEGSGKWMQVLRFRSSELLGGFTSDYDPTEKVSDPAEAGDRTLLDNVPAGENLTYALRLKKAANLTYTRVGIDLDPASPDYAQPNAPLTDYYEQTDGAPDYTTRTFMLQDVIQLIAGDVDGNGKTKLQDYEAVYDFVYRSRSWTELAEEPVPPTAPVGDPAWETYQKEMEEWARSIYAPDAMAYRCDLDGDRRVTVADLNIVNSRFNYNRDETDYHWYLMKDGQYQSVLPFGLGPRSSEYVSLFSLELASPGELFADPYWDAEVDPAETRATPLETYYIDGQGGFSLAAEAPPERAPAAPEEVPDHDQRPEIPLGEEALDHTAALPGVWEKGSARPEPAPEEEPTRKEPEEPSSEEPSSEEKSTSKEPAAERETEPEEPVPEEPSLQEPPGEESPAEAPSAGTGGAEGS